MTRAKTYNNLGSWNPWIWLSHEDHTLINKVHFYLYLVRKPWRRYWNPFLSLLNLSCNIMKWIPLREYKWWYVGYWKPFLRYLWCPWRIGSWTFTYGGSWTFMLHLNIMKNPLNELFDGHNPMCMWRSHQKVFNIIFDVLHKLMKIKVMELVFTIKNLSIW